MKVEQVFDYVIVGAGPAGIQLGYFLEKAGRDYVIVESSDMAGSFFASFPRHRTLLSINKVHTGRSDPEFNLRHDWNSLLTYPGDSHLFREYSRDYFPDAGALQQYLQDFAKRFSINIRYGFRVNRISRENDDGIFCIEADGGDGILCRRIVIATGLARPHVPEIPGIEHAEGYESVSVDPEEFAGKTVLILGKGNSAFETANNLIAHAAIVHLTSPHSVKFAWDTHFVGNLRAVNNHFLDTYLLKSQNGVLDGHVRSIERLPSGKLRVRWASIHTDIEEEIEQFEYDRVIRCTGFRFDDSIFAEGCKPSTIHGGKLPKMTGAWESDSVKDLYFAGTLMQTLDFKRSQSSFIHGFRYNVRTLFNLMETRYHGAQLPHDRMEPTPEALARRVIERSNGSSSLWQQVGFLCDVVRLPKAGSSSVEWYYDLNLDYVMQDGPGAEPDSEYYVIMMKYGPCGGTVVDHPHVHCHVNPLASGDLTTEIHPVVSRYSGADLKAEYHVRTDFMADWDSDFYREPLVAFFARDLQAYGAAAELPKVRRRELIRNSEMRFSEVTFDGVPISALRKELSSIHGETEPK
jgi:thioredoxin reductase